MEDKKEGNILCTCGGHCDNHFGMKHHLVRKVFIIVALLVTFCLGAQFGEIKGELRSLRGEHYGMMRGGYDEGYNYGNYRGPGMMGGYTNWITPTTPNTTTTPPTTNSTPAKP